MTVAPVWSVDGQIVADVAEERFTGAKHYAGPQMSAVGYCLDSQKLTINDIDVVAVATNASLLPLDSLLDLKERSATGGTLADGA